MNPRNRSHLVYCVNAEDVNNGRQLGSDSEQVKFNSEPVETGKSFFSSGLENTVKVRVDDVNLVVS
jgi:hypothetical protein